MFQFIRRRENSNGKIQRLYSLRNPSLSSLFIDLMVVVNTITTTTANDNNNEAAAVLELLKAYFENKKNIKFDFLE